MFDRLKKKPEKKPFGIPNKVDVETIEAPEVDDTLDQVDAALAKADEAERKARAKEEERRERERQRRYERDNGFSGGSCGC